MKTFRLFLWVLSCLFLASACKKDSNQTSLPPALPVITIIPNQTLISVVYKGSITVQWSLVGEYSSFSVTLNGVSISSDNNGSKTLDSLTVNQYFAFKAMVSDGRTVEKSLTVVVQSDPSPYLNVDSYQDTLPYGQSLDIGYSAIGDSLVVTNNKNSNRYNVPVGANKTWNTGLLYERTIFTFTAWKKGTSATTIADVKVAPMTRYDSLQGTHDLVDYLYADPGSTNYKSKIYDCQKDDYWVFVGDTIEMHEGAVWCIGTKECYPYHWTMISGGSQFIMGGVIYTIIELTPSKLVLTTPDLGLGGTGMFIFQRRLKK